jgi:TonB family protein
VSFQTIVRSMRRLLLLLLMVTTLFGSVAVAPGFAQEAISRKVKSRVEPTYPEIARRMGLTGNVKLLVVVAANGSVKETKVIGGHPILVNAAVDAMKKWKFEPGTAETSGTVEFKFEPGS